MRVSVDIGTGCLLFYVDYCTSISKSLWGESWFTLQKSLAKEVQAMHVQFFFFRLLFCFDFCRLILVTACVATACAFHKNSRCTENSVLCNKALLNLMAGSLLPFSFCTFSTLFKQPANLKTFSRLPFWFLLFFASWEKAMSNPYKYWTFFGALLQEAK